MDWIRQENIRNWQNSPLFLALGAGEQKIYAVIDPEDAIDEMHDGDDLIDNNTAYGLLYVAGADYLDPGLKKEMPYQEIRSWCFCLAQHTSATSR